MTWVRIKTSDTWHWMKSCSHVRRWLKAKRLRLVRDGLSFQVTDSRLISRVDKPTHGELCDQCIAADTKPEYR